MTRYQVRRKGLDCNSSRIGMSLRQMTADSCRGVGPYIVHKFDSAQISARALCIRLKNGTAWQQR